MSWVPEEPYRWRGRMIAAAALGLCWTCASTDEGVDSKLAAGRAARGARSSTAGSTEPGRSPSEDAASGRVGVGSGGSVAEPQATGGAPAAAPGRGGELGLDASSQGLGSTTARLDSSLAGTAGAFGGSAAGGASGDRVESETGGSGGSGGETAAPPGCAGRRDGVVCGGLLVPPGDPRTGYFFSRGLGLAEAPWPVPFEITSGRGARALRSPTRSG